MDDFVVSTVGELRERMKHASDSDLVLGRFEGQPVGPVQLYHSNIGRADGRQQRCFIFEVPAAREADPATHPAAE